MVDGSPPHPQPMTPLRTPVVQKNPEEELGVVICHVSCPSKWKGLLKGS